MSAFNQSYADTIARYSGALLSQGVAGTNILGAANGVMLRTLNIQATVSAYSDIFTYCAIFSLMAFPFAFLFPPTKAGGKGRPGAAK